MRCAARHRRPVGRADGAGRAGRQKTASSRDSTMPGGKRQHGVSGIGGWSRLRSPARWQRVRHGPPIGPDEPRRHDVLPFRHLSQAARATTAVLNGSVASVPSRLSGRKPRGVHSPKIAIGSPPERASIGQGSSGRSMIIAALAARGPEPPLARARHRNCVDHCRHPSCPWIGCDELGKACAYLWQRLGRWHRRHLRSRWSVLRSGARNCPEPG